MVEPIASAGELSENWSEEEKEQLTIKERQRRIYTLGLGEIFKVKIETRTLGFDFEYEI